MSVRTLNIEWEVKDSNETDGKVIVHPVTDADVVRFTPPSGMSATNVEDAIIEVKNSVPVTSVNGQTGAVTISVPTKDSDLTNDRYVRYDTNAQGLSSTQKSNARTNIGAGTSNFSGNYNDLSNKPSIPNVPHLYAHNITFYENRNYSALSFVLITEDSSPYTTISQIKTAVNAKTESYGGNKRGISASGKYSSYNTLAFYFSGNYMYVYYTSGNSTYPLSVSSINYINDYATSIGDTVYQIQ